MTPTKPGRHTAPPLKDLGQGRVSAGPPDPTCCDLVFNATPVGMEDGDPLPVDAALLTSSMFVGDVIAGTANSISRGCGGRRMQDGQRRTHGRSRAGPHADFLLQKADASNGLTTCSRRVTDTNELPGAHDVAAERMFFTGGQAAISLVSSGFSPLDVNVRPDGAQEMVHSGAISSLTSSWVLQPIALHRPCRDCSLR